MEPSLIRVESDLDYYPVITWAASSRNTVGLGVMGDIFKDGYIDMGEAYYLRPRKVEQVACTDC